MAPRCSTIPLEEWERNKETIKDLFAKKRLTEVIEEMKQKHNFDATKAQYEARLKAWGIRKNLKKEELQKLSDLPESIPATGFVTSSGRVREQQSLRRALRRLQKSPGTVPGQSSHATPESHPSTRVMSSSVGVSDGQMSQTMPQAGIAEHETDDVGRHRDTNRGSLSPESALLRLGEVTANFHAVGSTLPFQPASGHHTSFEMSTDWGSTLDYPLGTTLLTADGQDMFGMDLDSTFDSSWHIPINANVSPAGGNLMRQASPNIGFQPTLNDNLFSGMNMEFAIPEDSVYQTDVITFPPSNLRGVLSSSQPLSENVNYENGISDLWLSPSSTKQWLNRLPFANFEEYLNSQNDTFNGNTASLYQQIGASLSGSFAIRSLANSLTSSSRMMVLQRPGSQNRLQNLEKFIPGGNSGIISGQHMIETRLIRALLFSITNGFVGLNLVSMEDILKSMGHISTELLFRILQDGPPFTSRTLADNMFRAAIEAKNERIVGMLLERRLVDPNDTVCFFRSERYTPVERAATLQAHGLVRTLVEAGADVNKTHGDNMVSGALRKLLQEVTVWDKTVTATPALMDTLHLLIETGSNIDLKLLEKLLSSFKNKSEVARLIYKIMPTVDHVIFFKHDDDDDHDDHHHHHDGDACPSFAGWTATHLDDATATAIVQKMIELCGRSGCFKCLEKRGETIQYAAVEGAKRGHFKLVQLLIRYVKSTTKILSAAIRSGNSALIRLVKDSDNKPDLDPRPQSLGRSPYWDYKGPYLERQQLYYMIPTTPLAEAVRTGNADLITVLEKSGASSAPKTTDRLEALVLAAAEGGNIPYLERLLETACSSSHKYRPHSLAISLALEHGHDVVAEKLLSAGAEVSSTQESWSRLFRYPHDANFNWVSPLQVALVQKRDHTLVNALFSADITRIDIRAMEDVVTWFDTSILFTIASAFPDSLSPPLPGKLAALLVICERCMETNNLPFFKIFLDSLSSAAHPWQECLPIAIRAGNSEMVDLLLRMGANPVHRDVLKAAIPKRPEMLQLLFGKDRKQWTEPKCIGAHVLKFVLAEQQDNSEALKSLLDRGLVNLTAPEECENYRDEHSLTPLGLAILGFKNYCETNLVAVNQLLQAGSDPNRIARLQTKGVRVGETALMLAIETGREDVVQLLLRNKADVNKKPDLFIKRSPLQYAAQRGNLDMVRFLMRYDADVNCEPAIRSGGTALQLAAISGNCNLADELLKVGAQLHALPSKVNGRWPLEGAAEHGRLDMIQFLWNAKDISLNGAGFHRRQCLRAMDFARSNGHLGCRDLIANLSGISVETLDLEDYGAPWLAY